MKSLITLLILLLPIIGNGQKLIEASFSNEDKAICINYIDVDNHFIIGAANGVYKYDRAKIEHQKYKAGYSILQSNILNGQNSAIWTASICYNQYKTIYNFDQVKKMPKVSFELGFRTDFTERIWIGANYDIVSNQGGFNVAILIFK